MRWLVVLLIVGCGKATPDPTPAPLDAGGVETGGEPDVAASPGWQVVKRRYGRLLAIAGKGATDSRVNEWQPAFEGGAATAAELSRPHFAMADDAGNVYIADKEAHGIRKVTPDGRITTVAGTNAVAAVDDSPGPAIERAVGNPNGLYVRGDGTLYILDFDHTRIRKVTPNGIMTTMFEVPGGFGTGRGLWVAPDESEAFVAAGTVVKRWTPAGGVSDFASGFSDLGNLTKDRAGRLLVSDRAAGQVFALVAAATGVVKTVIAGSGKPGLPQDGGRALDTPLTGVRAVWPAHPGDDDGGIFVGTHEGCQVWYIDAAGIAHLFVDGARNAHGGEGEPFDAPGKKVSELRSLSLDRNGNLFIVDDDRGFVRKVERL